MADDPLNFSLEPKTRRIRGIQDEITKRAAGLIRRPLGDVSALRFDLTRSLFQNSSFVGRVDQEHHPVGWIQVDRGGWVAQSIALYGGIVLCDGTLIELMVTKEQRDVLRAVVNGGRDRFELTGLEKDEEMGSRTELRWTHGPLPQAFQAPWLGATDWHLPESVSFLMGKPQLEEHEVLPFVFLRGWAWYRWECRRIARD